MDSRELHPFTLILPVPYEGDFYDRNNDTAKELKKFLNEASGGILKANQLGQLASGLVHGQVFRIDKQPKANLYGLAEEGRGITFHHPEVLYSNWPEQEAKVGETMQHAMRNIIDYALDQRTLSPVS